MLEHWNCAWSKFVYDMYISQRMNNKDAGHIGPDKEILFA